MGRTSDKKRILITTMHRGNNFGSALQTYALSEILKGLNNIPIILDYIPKRINITDNILSCIKKIFNANSFKDKYNSIRAIAILISNQIIYNHFFSKHINLTKSFKSYNSIVTDQSVLKNIDVYMTGSDQVWNSSHNQGIDYVYFLNFAPDSKPRISYAASFGKEKLDDWEIPETRSLLKRYNAISVRERSAVDILHNIGLNGTHVLDPTLLLSKEEWIKRIPSIKGKEKYLLIYSVEPNKTQLIRLAKQIARILNLKIYMVEWGIKKYDGIDKMLSFISPLKLLSYFVNADFIIASSFHGTALSINFHKQFISIQPNKFNTRVKSILEVTGLTERLMDICSFSIEKATAFIDYSPVNSILNNERNKSLSFLKLHTSK